MKNILVKNLNLILQNMLINGFYNLLELLKKFIKINVLKVSMIGLIEDEFFIALASQLVLMSFITLLLKIFFDFTRDQTMVLGFFIAFPFAMLIMLYEDGGIEFTQKKITEFQ